MSQHGRASQHALELKRLALLKSTLAPNPAPGVSPAPHRSDDAPFPLLPAQERLLVLEHLYDTQGAYNIALLVQLVGALDCDDFRAALRFLVGRHDALRLSMRVDHGKPTQSAVRELKMDFELHDLRAAADPAAEARQLAEREGARRFAVDRPPLWRVRLYRLTDTEHRVLFCVHHIIADGGSLAVLLEELALAYAAIHAGAEPQMRPPVRFADCVDQALRAQQSETAAHALAYWRRQLEGVPDHLPFPRGPGAGAVARFRGGRRSVSIPARTTQALKAIARDSSATVFMLLLAAYEVLLHHLSGQASFLVAVPTANRRTVEAQKLVGFFVNTLLIRADLAGDISFRDLLARTRHTALAAFEHQDAPFAELVQQLNPARDLDRQPLAQVMFVLQNTPLAPFSVPGLELKILPFHNGTAKFDLLLDLHEQDGAWSGYLEYRSAVFSADAAEQIAREYGDLLERICEDPDRTVSALLAMDEQPMQQARSLTPLEVLSSFSDRHTIHGRFAERVRLSPHAIALTYQGHHVSYRVLDIRSDVLACSLRAQGIARGQHVGLLLDRSVEMVVALLAILKVGAAYVPLDPIYPTERLRQILDVAACSAVVTERPLAGILPSGGVRHLLMESLASEPDGTPAAPTAERVCPDHCAYIVFTSGSTGAPKGVIAHHRGALNHLDHVARKYSLSSQDVILQTASLISDASVEDLFGALLQGCRVVLMPSADARDPSVWLRLIEKERVTAILASTPRFLAQLGRSAAKAPGDRRSLRLVFVNGEPLSYEDCAHVRRGLGAQVSVINQYGPTEAAVTATEFRVDSGSPSSGPTPLGLPLSNVEFCLLDDQMRHVIRGAPGELYIGGVGLAHGYQARPALTAACFVPNPFATKPGARLYRTGDRLMFTRSEGFLFVGRVDQQIKIRGYRIEPGEIEAAMDSFPGVTSSLVVPRKDASDNDVLVAYFVADAENFPTCDLRAALKSRIPRYMMPAAFVQLESMPLTPNGKADRSRLPSPSALSSAERADRAPPRDAEEAAVCGFFESVLSRAPVGRLDNFFDLGGHSLAAIRLASLLSDHAGREVPVREVFLNPTVAELAERLRSDRADPQDPTHRLGDAAHRRSAPAVPVSGADQNALGGDPKRIRNVRIHRAPLLAQIRSGLLPAVDAVAISTLPNELQPLLEHTSGLGGLADSVEIASISDTTGGRIASLWVPIYTRNVYANPTRLMACLLEAVDLAQEIGASAVSLTGLLGSATAQGANLVAARGSGSRAAITTGHATTVASILLGLQAMLAATGRPITEERVVVLGLGSIGTAVARSLLMGGFEPTELLLCDVYDRRDVLARTTAELQSVFERCNIRFVDGPVGGVPDELYEASLIVGATNAPEVLDVARLRPGTLIVDDSSPHCFNAARMLERIRQRRDVLVATGGLVSSPRPIFRDLYVPRALEMAAAEHDLSLFVRQPDLIPACALSALMTATRSDVLPTLGLCTGEECLHHLREIRAMGMQASPLQLAGTIIAPEIIADFSKRFGRSMPDSANLSKSLTTRADP